jgi:aspartate racemase
MKKIGIIGGLSAESTIEYYKIIIKRYNEIKGGLSYPELIIDSLDLGKMTNFVSNNEWDKVLFELESSAHRLIKAGAEVLIMATNTPHIVFDKLEKQITTPILSIMNAIAEAIVKRKLKKVGLLGTRFTMQSDYYLKALQKYGIDVISPTLEDQKIIDDIIWEELVRHILTAESKQKYLAVIENLKNEGAEGIILGCTEIPLLIKQDDCDIPVFDTAYIHSIHVLEYALKE